MPSKVRKPGGLFDKHPKRIEEGLQRLENIRRISAEKFVVRTAKEKELRELLGVIGAKIKNKGEITNQDINLIKQFIKVSEVQISSFRAILNSMKEMDQYKKQKYETKLQYYIQARKELIKFVKELENMQSHD